MDGEADTFSIIVRPRSGGGYKSISNLRWDNIPGLAILTGKNGSGKTQLLELLGYHFSEAIPHGMSILPVEVESPGFAYKPDEVGYVPSFGRFSGGESTSIATMPDIRRQAIDHARSYHQYRHDIAQVAKAKRLLKLFGDRDPRNVTEEDIKDILTDDFEFAISGVDVTSGLTHVFYAYRVKAIEAIARGTPGFDENGSPLGSPPWTIVNESLSVAGFPYEVISPEHTKLLDTYHLRLRDRSNGNEIAALDLSSGEKVLLQLVLWLFTAGKEGVFPRLLLLDEPDAHLHPSMTRQFLDVISDVLVNKHNVRVILTTHSPSTVALAPEGSVFQLERGASAIQKVASRSDIISVLTAGLVTVSVATKFCFVEDEDDVEFYNAIREILTDFGPSRDPMALRPSPTLAFIPVSVGAGSEKIAGGATIVRKWIEKLDADPLSKTFLGVIDRDKNNVSDGRVFAIGRYSFENYLLDPLTVFALLVEDDKAPAVEGLTIGLGDEHLLRRQDASTLQKIADVVCSRMEASDDRLSELGQTKTVKYTTGAVVQVPAWVIDFRGHDLLRIAQKAFGGHQTINPLRLRKALKRCRLVPEELAKMFAAIQAR